MNTTDPIADMLTRIRNANAQKHATVDVPYSKEKEAIANILVSEGFVESMDIIEDNHKTIRITLKYVNTVSSNFSLKNTNTLTQNGTILQNLINDTSVINANFNFTIHLLDNNDQEYKAVVSFEIPLSKEYKNILVEGNILKIEDNLNINFLKVN